MKNQRMDDMYEQWETALIRRALLERIDDAIQDEQAEWDEARQAQLRAEIAEMRPRVNQRIDRALSCRRAREGWKRRLARGLRGASAVAAMLAVAFSGVCLASPALRRQLCVLVERQWGSYTEIRSVMASPEVTDPVEETSRMTVDPDDPRLRYVYPDWCGHYYPLNAYTQFQVSTLGGDSGNYTTVQQEDGDYWYITDEERARALEADYMKIVFQMPEAPWHFEFVEDGRPNAYFHYDNRFDEMRREVIDDKEVFVYEKGDWHSGDAYFISLHWWEGDHLLSLSGKVSPDTMMYIFHSVERIR